MRGAPAIRASVLALIATQLDEIHGRADELLSRHAIARSQLGDPYALIPIARYLGFFEDAALSAGADSFGARLGSILKPADIGPAGILFTLSATIRIALSRMSRHIHSVQGETITALDEVDDRLVWGYQISQRRYWPRRQDSEFTLSACCQFIRMAFSHHWRPLEVHFEHPQPRDVGDLKRIFRAPLLFDQPSNRIFLDRAEADRLVRVEDSALSAILERHIADLTHEPKEDSLTEKARSLVTIYLGYQTITVPRIAADLGLSPRSLQRRLAAEGSSLRQIVQACRREVMARQLEAKVKKRHIAENLGYADSTVFWRARRTWD